MHNLLQTKIASLYNSKAQWSWAKSSSFCPNKPERNKQNRIEPLLKSQKELAERALQIAGFQCVRIDGWEDSE